MIPLQKIEALIPLEPFVVAWAGLLASWAFYRFFLREISAKRHASMRGRFRRLTLTLLLASTVAGSYWSLKEWANPETAWARLGVYLALAALVLGALVVIWLAQVLLYLHLFFANIRTGVPRLVANLFTLVFGTLVAGWIASHVFDVRFAPILATSAIFSIILGLALQDTLGNLFSGVGLQLDKPYGIGDWVEIHSGSQKWTGQIQEITWRATLLLGFGDELISIPNKTMAQSQVLIFTHPQRPPRKSQAFRLPFDAPVDRARQALLQSVDEIPGILRDPAPSVLVTELAESWVTLKLFYSVEDFGAQYRVGDLVLTRALDSLRAAGLPLAGPSLKVIQG